MVLVDLDVLLCLVKFSYLGIDFYLCIECEIFGVLERDKY